MSEIGLPTTGFSEGPKPKTATVGDVWNAAWSAQWQARQIDSAEVSLDEAYEKRNREIEAATGQKLFHPLREQPTEDDYEELSEDLGVRSRDRFQAVRVAERRWHRDLSRLAEQRPDLADKLRPEQTVWSEVEAKYAAAKKREQDAIERSPLTADVPILGPLNPVAFGASFAATMMHPEQAIMNIATGLAVPGSAARGILWNATQQALANSALQLPLELAIKGGHDRIGAEYTWAEAGQNIAIAGLFGGGLDAAGRSIARYRQGLPMGGSPALPKAGAGQPAPAPANENAPLQAVDGAFPEPVGTRAVPGVSTNPAEALEAAARGLPEAHPLRKAAEGDPEATIAVAERLAPFSDDPEGIRGALDQFRLETRQEQAIADTLASAQDDAALAARIRALDYGEEIGRAAAHVADPDTVPPARPVLVADAGLPEPARINAPGASAAELGSAKTSAPEGALKEGQLAPLDAARLIRERPELAGELPPTTELARQVHALAALSDAAFARVEAGEIDAPIAALVAASAPPGAHVDLATRLTEMRPRDMAEARRHLAGMMQQPVDSSTARMVLGLADDVATDADGNRINAPVGTGQPKARLKSPEFDEPVGEGAKTQADALAPIADRQRGIDGLTLSLRSFFSRRRGADDARAAAAPEARPTTAAAEQFFLVDEGETPGFAAFRARMRSQGLTTGAAYEAAVPLSQIRRLEPTSDLKPGLVEKYAAEPPPRSVNVDPEKGVWLYRDGNVYYIGDGHHRFAAALQRGDAVLDAQVRDIVAKSDVAFRLADGGSLAGTAYAPRFAAAEAAIAADIAEAARLTLPRGMGFEVADRLRVGGYELDGYFDRRHNLIAVALDAGDPRATFSHERIHALKAHGLFAPEEWGLLVAEARKRGVRQEMGRDLVEEYRDLLTGQMVKEKLAAKGVTDASEVPWPELQDMLAKAKLLDAKNVRGSLEARGLWDEARLQEMIDEETVARLVEGWRGGEAVPGGVSGLLERLMAFLERVRNVLKGHGFQTLDDVFRRIDDGEVAMRTPREVALPGGVKVSGIHLRAGSSPDIAEMLLAIRAYHGSPHDFDRFSLDRIGTGEGAQAYGHGLYFAESRGVAEYYKDVLSVVDERQPSYWASWAFDAAKGDRVSAAALLTEQMNRMQAGGEGAIAAVILRARGSIQRGDGIEPLQAGRLYEVRINADPDQFLDWDKPLSQQSEKVRQAVAPLIDKELAARRNLIAKRYDGFPDLLSKELAQLGPDRLNGESVVRGNERVLREAGIPGIKYLDQGSRGAGEGSRNYVVFDDSLIEIVAKDGVPTAPPSLSRALEAAEAEAGEGMLVQACRLG